MADPFTSGDEARRKYLEQAAHANDAAASGSKFSDLYDKNSTIYKDPNADKPKPTPEPLPPKPTVDAEGYPIIEQVHTYREDLADIVSKDKLSLSRIAMMQGTANKGLAQDNTPPKKRANILLIISIALVVMGIGIAGAVFMLAVERNTIEAPSQNILQNSRYIIFAESNEIINLPGSTKTEIGAEIAGFTENFREEQSVKEIIPKAESGERAPLYDLFTTTNARMPEALPRAIADRFFLGLYSLRGVTYPFLLYYVDSYDIAYPSMLEWEGFMPDDMSFLFPKPPRVGTTTQSFIFKDRVIANNDARSYEDSEGRSAFFYMFLDDNTILMARSADTVRMVEDRLRQAKFQ